jgi:hypothetical protein
MAHYQTCMTVIDFAHAMDLQYSDSCRATGMGMYKAKTF